VDTGERRGKGGTPVYLLSIADDTSAVDVDRTADRTADKIADDTSAVQPGTADKTADETYPTTDYRRPTTARKGDSAKADDAKYKAWARTRARAKGGGTALENKIHDEDRHIFDEGQRQKAAVRVLNECARCDSAGWLLGVNGDPIIPTLKCSHDHMPTGAETEAIARASLGAEGVKEATTDVAARASRFLVEGREAGTR
jgi:hypothetical protein